VRALGWRRTFVSAGLAEEAVTCEPVSATNSLQTGKNTGNFIDFGTFGAISIGLPDVESMVCERISLRVEAGNFEVGSREA
jgi:hypothetical protein